MALPRRGRCPPRSRPRTTTTPTPTKRSPRTAAATTTSSTRSATRRSSRSRACRRRPTVRIYAKLEMVNPTGSVKDRAAKYLIEDLERSGRLHGGLDHPRADVGQHGHRSRDDRAPQGLPRRARHARQRDQRAAPDGGPLRCRGDRLAGGAGLQRRDRTRQATSSRRTAGT